MRFFIRAIKRGGLHVDKHLKTQQISIGQQDRQDIQVFSQRIGTRHALIEQGENGKLKVRALTPIGVVCNGQTVTECEYTLGDVLEIGNCQIALQEPPEGLDCDYFIELKETRINQAKELETALLARSNLDFDNTGLSMRRWAWRLLLFILIFLLLIPLLGISYKPIELWLRTTPLVSDRTWNSGPISRSHKAFGNDCGACHEKAFIRVRDSACENCHKAMPHHLEQGSQAVDGFSHTRCAICHKEHTNEQTFIPHHERLCSSCHAAIKQQLPDTELRDTADFERRHPEFKATLTGFSNGQETRRRVGLDDKAKLKEQSNLEFSHKGHLAEKGIRSPRRGMVHLDCQDCHQPEEDGRYMASIEFEAHCHECHTLNFEAYDPKREVPHGDAAAAQEFLRQFYADRVSKENDQFFTELSPTSPAQTRRRPGEDLEPSQQAGTEDWIKQYPVGVTSELFRYRGCGSCHQVSRDAIAAEPSWKIQPVRLATPWFPKAKFDHASHKTQPCTDCHEAKQSDSSEDVLMKGIATCRECHGNQESSDQIASTCIHCHGFHQSKTLALSGKQLKPASQGAGSKPFHRLPASESRGTSQL